MPHVWDENHSGRTFSGDGSTFLHKHGAAHRNVNGVGLTGLVVETVISAEQSGTVATTTETASAVGAAPTSSADPRPC